MEMYVFLWNLYFIEQGCTKLIKNVMFNKIFICFDFFWTFCSSMFIQKYFAAELI